MPKTMLLATLLPAAGFPVEANIVLHMLANNIE
jgi:hypothetical protein